MFRMSIAVVLSAALGGCGGHYILTVPDQIAPAGGDATTVVRLQRNDFFVLSLPVKDAPIRFRVAEGKERAAHSDKLGYAGTTVSVPATVGRHVLNVDLQDRGDEIHTEAPVYVWDPDRPILAVDLDTLPQIWAEEIDQARPALQSLAGRMNILYVTRRPVSEHAAAHEMLAGLKYPDGPVLLWQRERWHIVRSGWRLPKIVIETRMVSQLAELRKTFKNLETGLCTGWLAARGFAGAGMRCVIVGSAKVDAPNVTRRESWMDLAGKGI